MIKKIDHLGIAVRDLDASIKRYEDLTGNPPAHRETVKEQAVDTAFFPLGDVKLELLKGISQESAVSRFIDKRGEGLHHICFEVEELTTAMTALTALGFEFVNSKSAQGAGDTKVAFIHPRSTGGILFELVEHPKPTLE